MRGIWYGLLTLLPYKYKVGFEVPYYCEHKLKITNRKRNFYRNYSYRLYQLDGVEDLWFSECLIEFYLSKDFENGRRNF